MSTIVRNDSDTGQGSPVEHTERAASSSMGNFPLGATNIQASVDRRIYTGLPVFPRVARKIRPRPRRRVSFVPPGRVPSVIFYPPVRAVFINRKSRVESSRRTRCYRLGYHLWKQHGAPYEHRQLVQ
ncbi:uncharacterized protein LOC143151077 [Ptiloglossa arizonensis]|uniref:uncharacterized protein LOC143151077 n=1 Tax=Ptiloglossa arizonensis TaxID=3350558 RepID=UPI003FA0313B